MNANRRWLVIAAGVVVVAAAAIGSVLGFSGGSGARLLDASFPGYQLSFRYPAAWKRKDWCWIGTSVFPLTLLTTARAAPTCQQDSSFGSGTPFPPPLRLGGNSIATWWFASDQDSPGPLSPNAEIDGQPARITVRRESTRRTSKSYVNCRLGATQRFLTAQIHGPSANVRLIEVGAVICGPGFAAGEAAVRKMLDSVRFTS
ncbi:MAG TPA: hypothetical protein VFJ11_01325 [Gaiellaceae bacterium]|nr:hypothetical protein [Gaiellaceae bacterium]